MQQSQLSKQDKHETQDSSRNSNSQLLKGNKHEKQELNMVAARNETELKKIGVKTMSILGKSGACLSPKQSMLGPNLL